MPMPATRHAPKCAPALALGLWLLFMVAAATLSVRARYVADLSAFLPSTPTPEQAVLLDQLRSGVAARLVLIGIEGGSAPARSQASRALAATLRASGQFESVNNGEPASAADRATGALLFAQRYLLSPAVDAQRFTVAGLRAGIDETVALLGTPAGAHVKPLLWRDPTGETLRIAQALLPAQAPRMEGGVWVSRRAPRAVLVAIARGAGADLDAQAAALQKVREGFATHLVNAASAASAASPASPAIAPPATQGLRLLVSGAGSFAVASRTEIRAEVERLAVVGSVALVGLLVVAFGGSLRTLGTALLPVASGVLAGIGAVSLSFGNVHGITLGFGTTLIGEAVDYAIYYLIQARSHQGSAKASAAVGATRWLSTHWPTVRLGLWTSLGGFAALMFSGFPGLAQLGVFSVAGLSAAALTTRWVCPVLAPNGAPGLGLRRPLGRVVGVASALLPRGRVPLALLAVACAVALAWWPSAWRGDLSALSPVSAAHLALDADLRADLGASDSGTLVALAAPDEAGVLALAEAAGARLDALIERGGHLSAYSSPARLLPSPATQAARRAALPDAPTLTARVAQACVDGPLPAARLSGFIADVQAARAQPLLTRAALQGTPLATALGAMLVAPEAPGQPWRALLSLETLEPDRALQTAAHAGAQPEAQADAQAQAQPQAQAKVHADALAAALVDLPGARVIHVGAELAALYTRYLHEAMWQAMLGALAVCVLLWAHLRSWRRLWRIAQPVVAAVLMVLALLTASGVALGVLHLVGLLLTVAIGSNYALFFDQIRFDQGRDQRRADATPGPLGDLDTLASLALANLTAVLSFGLLASSDMAALHALGVVVAPGVLLTLLLAAAFIPARPPRRTVKAGVPPSAAAP